MPVRSFVMPKRSKQCGFSLIEVMASVAIIAFGMLGVFSLVVYNQKIYLSTKDNFIGALLSEEGAELVRNVRDSNWLNSLPFNNGISGTFRIDTTNGIKGSIQAVSGIGDTNARLKILGGVYRHDTGDATAFARVIQIQNIDEPGGEAVDGLKITSLVQWEERGATRQRQTVVFLYDWHQ
jgi:prepilin-type N-terminal cleavage/methylation domain-containing protein